MACVARCLCVVTLFVCRACLSWLEERENSSRDSPGRFRAQDFDPLGLKPEDPEALKEMQTKELQHGRLAMLAAAGMIVQELQTGATLF
mmetsp:Transcript_8903/g.25643  ORF Transcript_8903/g.25643 Transcript_8903/m.25643 type:complete len:89 (-) Transcript_8903:153-419(-)